MNVLSPFERFKERIIGKVDNTRSQCWFFHRWSRWQVTSQNSIIQVCKDGKEGQVGLCTVQERYCHRCHKRQIDSIRTSTV